MLSSPGWGCCSVGLCQTKRMTWFSAQRAGKLISIRGGKVRVVTQQKVENSLTFHWTLNSFHWPFINEKQSMFTFALVFFFTGHRHFSLHFKPFSAFRGKRKKEFGRNHSQRKPLTTTTTQVRRSVSNWSFCCFACFAAYLSPFPKENAFQSLEENLWTINRKTKFPDFSLTLTISKIFPDFSLAFPWPWQPWK